MSQSIGAEEKKGAHTTDPLKHTSLQYYCCHQHNGVFWLFTVYKHFIPNSQREGRKVEQEWVTPEVNNTECGYTYILQALQLLTVRQSLFM